MLNFILWGVIIDVFIHCFNGRPINKRQQASRLVKLLLTHHGRFLAVVALLFIGGFLIEVNFLDAGVKGILIIVGLLVAHRRTLKHLITDRKYSVEKIIAWAKSKWQIKGEHAQKNN